MCVERVQRLMMAIMLGLIMGFAGAKMFAVAFVLQLFVIIMLVIWAITDFCPSTYILKKILPPCEFGKKDSE